MDEVKLQNCRVLIHTADQYLETVFDDGARLPAAANHGDEDEARAKALGYRNTWQMSLEHELLHSILSEAMGLKYSPTLHAVATGEKIDQEEIDMEERLVLCVQKLLNDARFGREPYLEAMRPR